MPSPLIAVVSTLSSTLLEGRGFRPLALSSKRLWGSCIAQNLGGPTEIVIPNVNGVLVSPSSDLTDATDWALTQLKTPESYARLARSARSEYYVRLNWRVSGQPLRSLIEGALDRHEQRGLS
jgi:glycosyltransferase involved in cell wall biosynthesis